MFGEVYLVTDKINLYALKSIHYTKIQDFELVANV